MEKTSGRKSGGKVKVSCTRSSIQKVEEEEKLERSKTPWSWEGEKVQKFQSSMIYISLERKKSLEFEYDALKGRYYQRFFYVIENLTKWSETTSSFNFVTIDQN